MQPDPGEHAEHSEGIHCPAVLHTTAEPGAVQTPNPGQVEGQGEPPSTFDRSHLPPSAHATGQSCSRQTAAAALVSQAT